MGKIMMVAGVVLLVLGAIIWLLGDKLSWFGNLPGDIRIEQAHFNFYFPITTMILLSIALSAFLWLVRKLF